MTMVAANGLNSRKPLRIGTRVTGLVHRSRFGSKGKIRQCGSLIDNRGGRVENRIFVLLRDFSDSNSMLL